MQICLLAASIEQDIRNGCDYRALERAVGFSYRHIREIFGKVTGISLSRYILMRRIANAAFEIRHSTKSITEIAYEYGFSNLDTFARAFRRDTGLLPSEFRKSSYHCGRRIICPGVYAPVILDLDNPRFVHPKLVEVNQMGEMQKTSDSCILYGVTKIYFGRIVDDQMQLAPFPMCLQSVLNYMGQNISYVQIMAASGAAFHQRFDINGWNMGAADIANTYKERKKPFELAFVSAGRNFSIMEKSDSDRENFLKHIKAELDCGRPLIALGVVGSPEACIITGYQNDGRVLLGWSLFQGDGQFDERLETHETGYFLRENWWENTEAVMSIGEAAGTPTPVKEVLKNALLLMTEEKIETDDKRGRFYGGQAAYEAWAKAVEEAVPEDESADMVEVAISHEEQEHMLWDRGFAAAYVSSLEKEYPDLGPELTECAGLLKAAQECVGEMQAARGGQGPAETVLSNFRKSRVRACIAWSIRQAAAYEKKACVVLERMIEKL